MKSHWTAAKTNTPNRPALMLAAIIILLSSILTLSPREAHACSFLVPDANGNAQRGPSLHTINRGFTHGLLDCGGENHAMMIITIGVDKNEPHVGVRDDPLFSADIVGELETVDDISISRTAKLHVLGRANASPRIGARRGFVRFATVCDVNEGYEPLNCSWGKARIKVRTTVVDTDADDIVDRSYHELSVYNGSDRLHMVTFWTPHRSHLRGTTADWISALHAFGIDISRASAG
ncbi:MAG: hypothetical protein AAFW47_07485 [Pseudomonadota bacterium]